jgi:N utilization substance protein A
MSTAVAANRLELLQIADAVAREKLIDRELVIEAMEDSLGKAARARYGADVDVRAHIDRKSGEVTMTRVKEVVEEVEIPAGQMSLEEARALNPETEVGDFVEIDTLPTVEFGRVAAQTAKQVIVQKVREAERERQYEEYKDRVGTIINGVVKRVEYGNVIVDLGRGEGMLRRDQLIPREAYRVGDRIRSYVRDVRAEMRGPQIFLSRTAPEFMAELFKMEVPEIYDGSVEIKAVARDPGSRAKIGVISYENSIDPVGACVGMRGSRVQAVVGELQGEKIDIIPWTDDVATFLVNALQPAEVAKVVMDEDAMRAEVVVPEEQLSLAIGRRGQNVRLASQLTGWSIDILTEEEESQRRRAEFEARTKTFMDMMNVDETVAQLLVAEGFTAIEEVAYVELDELSSIDGFDEGTAEELQARARESLEEIAQQALEKARGLGVQEDLIAFQGLSAQMVLALAEDGIMTLADFATCADWELAGGYTETEDGRREKDDGILEPFEVTLEEAQALVMTARVQLGIVEAAPVDAPAEDIDDEAPMFAEGDEAAFAADDEAVTDEPATEDASTDEAVDRPTQG